MTKLETKLIVVVAAAAIIAATMTTLETTKILNSATTSAFSGGLHNCNGCVTTQNLANGAVTTPKIAHGAVSISTTFYSPPGTILPPGTGGGPVAVCPPGTNLTGGGFGAASHEIIVSGSADTGPRGWIVEAFNPTSHSLSVIALAVCATIHP